MKAPHIAGFLFARDGTKWRRLPESSPDRLYVSWVADPARSEGDVAPFCMSRRAQRSGEVATSHAITAPGVMDGLGLVLAFDADGRLSGIEFLTASEQLPAEALTEAEPHRSPTPLRA